MNNISFDSQPLDLIPAHITSIKCLVFSYICDRRDLFSRVIIGALLLLLPNELASFHIRSYSTASTAESDCWPPVFQFNLEGSKVERPLIINAAQMDIFYSLIVSTTCMLRLVKCAIQILFLLVS